jgi:caspase domain-containing protein
MPNNKRALIIGIDKYPHLKQLEGCANDARVMEGILREVFDFPAQQTTLLVDDQATRDAILAAMDALVSATGPDDIVVIHYSGHGSQMTDRENDEPDGMDETIMPFDTWGRWGENRDITDDEIHLRLLRLGEKTRFTTLIFDSCHSGTITRDAFGVNSRSVEPDTRPAKDLPPSPIPRELWGGTRDAGPSGWMPLGGKYVLLAGCRSDETSYEFRPPEAAGDVVHGALTYFLAEELRSAVPGTTYRDVFERAAAKVTAAHSTQHPQMEGRGDREIFGIADIQPMRFVRVIARANKALTMGAGAAHGMTPGSQWSLYPQGTKGTEGLEPLGVAEIIRVQAITSEARLSEERAPGAVEVNARAVETLHDYGDLRLPVQVAGPTGDPRVAALGSVLSKSTLLRLVQEGEPASARVYLLPPRQETGPEHSVPQLGALAAPTWAAVTENGGLMMPPKQADDFAAIRQNLETLTRYRHALALDNLDLTSRLRGKVSLSLLRQAADGDWVIAEPEQAGGQVVFEEGERMAVRITNNHDGPLFVQLLDFGLTGKIRVEYPEPGAQEALGPTRSLELGVREEITLYMPDEYPYRVGGETTQVAEGLETLKLVVTLQPVDLSFIEQEGVRGPSDTASRGGSPLTLLWDTAVNGGGTREWKRVRLGQEDWTTVSQSFLLRRRQSVALDPGGAPLALGQTTLSTPGLTGRAVSHAGRSGRAEAEELTRPELTRALDEAGVAVEQTVEIENAEDRGVRAAGTEPSITVVTPDPGPGQGQMVLTTDELGVVSWHFAPVPEMTPAGGGRGGEVATRTYRIPAAVPREPLGGPATRSLVGAVGRKFLKVLVFPLLEPGIGVISETFAQHWEERHRPYRLRSFGPDDFRRADAAGIDGEGWARLGSGRALLMVHGTFSRAHSAFGAFPREFVEELYRWYGGRMFALDHFTLSHNPRQNVDWFLRQIPDGTSLDLDIICHSRGGLVSRVLSEKQGELGLTSRSVRVNRVVFVGAPNAGTILADSDHVGDFLDSYTNLLNFIPDAGVSDVLAGIITVAKQLAVGAVKGLSGLQSMRPGGEFGTWLNTGPRSGEARYFALASDFTPVERGLKELAADRLMDKIFKKANDLVVPTEGVFSENGSGFFPIEQRFVFEGPQSVAHTAYFGSPGTRTKIAEWLVGAGG